MNVPLKIIQPFDVLAQSILEAEIKVCSFWLDVKPCSICPAPAKQKLFFEIPPLRDWVLRKHESQKRRLSPSCFLSMLDILHLPSRNLHCKECIFFRNKYHTSLLVGQGFKENSIPLLHTFNSFNFYLVVLKTKNNCLFYFGYYC